MCTGRIRAAAAACQAIAGEGRSAPPGRRAMDCDEDDDGEGISFTVSHPEKVLFPKARITKGELVDYYEAVSPWMLPHLRDRPLTLHRFPAGVEGRGFYHKQIEDDAPPWIERVTMGTRDGEAMTYALANNGATLIHFANKNSIA